MVKRGESRFFFPCSGSRGLPACFLSTISTVFLLLSRASSLSFALSLSRGGFIRQFSPCFYSLP